MDVKTLQERLEQKARTTAIGAASNAIANLPQFQGVITIPLNDGTADLEVNFFELKQLMRAFFEQQYTEAYLDQYTQELMDKLGR